MKKQMMKQTTTFMIMIIIGLTISLSANASTVSVFPQTWFEISTEGGIHLDLEQGIVWVAAGSSFSSRGFWQYSISGITSQFLTIDSVSLKIPKITNAEGLDVNFREADFNPKISDWTAYENNSFYQSRGYFESPESIVDITDGFKAALDLGIENIGIMIWNGANSGFEPASNAEILITGNPTPSIIVTFPNGGEELFVGETFEITWTSEGEIDFAKIEYSVNNGSDWTEIVASTENNGFYNWEIPCDISAISLIRISDLVSGTSDTSDATFFITDTDSDGDGIYDCNDICNYNGICNPPEDCSTCPEDCIGKDRGKPTNRYCCGDEVCEGEENSFNCAVDCGPPPECGDGVCEDSEICSCIDDCDLPPFSETSCTDGIDNDCDDNTDCDDADCSDDWACICKPKGEWCSSNEECCSNDCRGKKCK